MSSFSVVGLGWLLGWLLRESGVGVVYIVGFGFG